MKFTTSIVHQWWIQDLQKGGGGGGGGHKIMDLLSLHPHIYKITKTTKWEVVKNCASPKRPLLGGTSCHFSHFKTIPLQIIHKHNLLIHFWPQFIFSLRQHPPPIPNSKRGGGGGAHSTCIFIFLLGHTHIWPKKGGHPPPRSTYVHSYCAILKTWSDFSHDFLQVFNA